MADLVLVALEHGFGIRAGVQLDVGDAKRARGIDLRRIGVDEERNANRGAETANIRRQAVVQSDGIQAAFGGDFLTALGDETAGARFGAQGDLEHLFGRAHLEIERHAGAR